MLAFTPDLRTFRWMADDGNEAGATFVAAIGANLASPPGARWVLRCRIQEAGGASGATTDDWKLQISKNAGAYQDVTTSSTVVKAFNSSNLTDAGATTNRLGAGSGSFVAGKVCEDGTLDDLQLTANNFTELVYTVEFVGADLIASDNITFRIVLNGATFLYVLSPYAEIIRLEPATFPDSVWRPRVSAAHYPAFFPPALKPDGPTDSGRYHLTNDADGAGYPSTQTLHNFKNQLTINPDAPSNITVSVADQTTESDYWATPVGEPGVRGRSTGTFVVTLNAGSNVDLQVSGALYRYSADGLSWTKSAYSTEVFATGMNITFVDPPLGPWGEGDRLVVELKYRDTSVGGDEEWIIVTGAVTGTSLVTVPWYVPRHQPVTYPAIVPTKRIAPTSHHQAYFAPPTTPEPTPDKWSSIYPDRVYPAGSLRTTAQLSFAAPQRKPTRAGPEGTYYGTNTDTAAGYPATQTLENFKKILSIPTVTPTALPAVTIADSATEDDYLATPVGEPGVRGTSNGTFVVFVAFGANADLRISVALFRYAADGLTWSKSEYTPEQVCDIGRTFTIIDPPLGEWAAGDRLVVALRLRDTTAGDSETLSYVVGDELRTLVRVPWYVERAQDLSFPSIVPTRRTMPTTHQQAFFATYVPVEPVPDLWSAIYPHRVEPMRGLAPHYQLAFVAPGRQPDPPPHSFDGVFPERVLGRPRLSTSAQLAMSAQPTRQPDPPPHSFDGVFPERVPTAPRLTTGSQVAFAAPSRQPDPPLHAFDGVFPERISPRSGLSAPLQMSMSEPLRQPDPPTHSWDGVFPERVRGLTLHVSQRPSFVSPHRQPDPPEVRAIYPVKIDPPQSLSAAAQLAHVAPDRQPDPPELAWLGLYPERVEPARGLSAREQLPYVAPSRQPDPPEVRTIYPSKIDPVRALSTASQRSFTAPERQPDPPTLSWSGIYPERARAAQRLDTASQRAHVSPERQPDPPALAWVGVYPERAPTSAPRLATPSHRSFTAPDRQPDPPELSWLSVHPDQLRPLTLLPVYHQLAFAMPDRQPDVDGVGWLASYPAWIIPTRGLATPQQRAWFGLERLEVTDLGDVSWLARYPDQLSSRPFPVVEQRAWFGPDRQPDPDGFQVPSWLGVYPDHVDTRRLLTASQAAWFGSQRQPDPPEGAQRGAYPSQIDRARMPTSAQRAFTAPERQPDPPARAWDAVYPSKIDERTLPTSAQQAHASPARQPDPPAQSWHSTHPDKLDPVRGLPVQSQIAHVVPNRQPDPPVRSWSSVHPDRVPSERMETSAQSAFAAPTRQPEPPDAWRPVHPVKIDPARALPTSQQRAYMAPERQPDPPVLSWGGVYPERARAASMLATSSQLAFVVPEQQPEPPPMAWTGVYPERVPEQPGLSTGSQLAYVAPERQPEPPPAWVGVYPERAAARAGLDVRSQQAFTAPTQQPEPPALSWGATYSDSVSRRLTHASQLQAYTSADRQPEPSSLSWIGVYVDRVTGLRFDVDLQQAFASSMFVEADASHVAPVFPDVIIRRRRTEYLLPALAMEFPIIVIATQIYAVHDLGGELVATTSSDGLTGAVVVPDGMRATAIADVDVGASSTSDRMIVTVTEEDPT